MRLFTALLGATSALALCAPALAGEPAAGGDPGAFNLGEITVTAPRASQGVTVDPNTLSSQAIYTFNTLTLDQAVNLIPGVAASATGGPRNEGVITVRGFNRFEAPLSIDGIRVYLPADNRLDYSRFLTDDIAEIQVAKGYASVIDGPDAMGGAVNLVTRKPTQPFEVEARGETTFGSHGDYEGYNAFGLVGARRDLWYAQASYTRDYVNHFDVSQAFAPTATQGNGERYLSRSDDWRVNVKAGVTPNGTDEYSISYTEQDGSKQAPLSTTDPLSIQKDWSWPYWDISSLYFLSTTALPDDTTLRTRLYRNTFDNLLSAFDNANENTQLSPKSFNSYYQDQGYGGSAILDHRFTSTDTASLAVYGREDEHVQWEQTYAPTVFTQPHQTSIEDSYSLALENKLAITPALTFTAGASYDWRIPRQAQNWGTALINYPLHDTDAWNGQGKLDWKPDAASDLYASISSRVRFPTLFERFSTQFGGAVSNPYLQPERGTNYEVGGSHLFGGLHAEAALFYSDLTNVIVSIPFIYNGTAVTQSRNVGHGDYYGAELSLSERIIPPLELGGNVTWIHQDLDNPGTPGFQPTDVPTSKAFIYADWSPIPPLHVTPNVDLASDRWEVNAAGTQYFRAGAYVLVNARVAYTVYKGVEVGVGGANLLDQNYELAGSFPAPGRTVFVDIRARY